ncbi:hypothetical protein RWE15_22270 [Virgibacillus halophilus]|uniref:Uncharacterized protein n=1 Tax=Tigheibacillus halophilus TaxID=361280 RepID=A0ABU5CCF7_9BACI|nr:hypothetical protein [Virgibacillus halophilus]
MSFIPVADDEATTGWVRAFYYKYAGKQSQLLSLLYKDLLLALAGLPERECAMLVDQLTGYEHYGLSTSQLAEKYGLSKHDVVLLLASVRHLMLHNILSAPHRFNILPALLDFMQKKHEVMTNTANKTYMLYKKRI